MKLCILHSQSCRTFTANEISFILNVLNDVKAWPVGRWTLTSRPQDSDWSIALEMPSQIQTECLENKFSNCSSFGKLSVTYMSEKPRRTTFNYKNWTKVPDPVKDIYTLEDYRIYLVLHECGHALGLGHKTCRPGNPAPIMLQHSLGLKGCEPNLWPLAEEKELLHL